MRHGGRASHTLRWAEIDEIRKLCCFDQAYPARLTPGEEKKMKEDKDFVCCSDRDICPFHERMRDAEAEAAVTSEGVDPESEEADFIRRRIGGHGDWHDTDTPCGI